MKSKTYNGEVRSSEKDFETLQLGAFAPPGLLLAQRAVGLTAESDLISRHHSRLMFPSFPAQALKHSLQRHSRTRERSDLASLQPKSELDVELG